MRTRRLLAPFAWLLPCYLVILAPCLTTTARAFDPVRDSPLVFDEVIDSPMYEDPALPPPTEVITYVGSRELWRKALARPEADLRRRVIDTIALARRREVKGLEWAVAPLREELDRPDQHPAVRLAAARALVILEARETAPSLWRQAQSGGSDLRGLVEPALARWDYRPARAVWLERLRDRGTPFRSLVLAIRGLAAVGEEKAVAPLRDLVLSDRVPVAIRLEAARALGTLRGEGLEKDAERLAGNPSPQAIPARLAAAALLRRHRGPAAVAILKKLGQDNEPAVAARAIDRLLQLDVAFVLPMHPKLLTSPDPKLRAFGVEVLRRVPSGPGIRLLGDRLTDRNSDVRVLARKALRELGEKEEFRRAVLAEGDRVLGKEAWEGREQAMILLVRLGHRPVAGRLVDLLFADRPQVCITAAWGLRSLLEPQWWELPVTAGWLPREPADQRTLDRVTAYVSAKEKAIRAGAGGSAYDLLVYDHQLAQLNQLLGRQHFARAEPVLRRFIPRMEQPMMPPVCPEARAAALWALGLFQEGKPDPGLVAPLEGRLNDIRSIPPEDIRVRRMAAVTLGRMKAAHALPSLRKYCPDLEPTDHMANNACGWAVGQITGKKYPALKTVRKNLWDWFLRPLPRGPAELTP